MSLIQTLFDKVVIHLLTQGHQSLDSGSCAYRGAFGSKCAIGALIDDEVYCPSIEHRNIAFKPVRALVAKSNDFKVEDLTESEWSTLTALQHLHDSYEPLIWEESLKVIAEINNLTMPNLDY